MLGLRIFDFVVADAALAGYEDHGCRAGLGDIHGIMAGAARKPLHRVTSGMGKPLNAAHPVRIEMAGLEVHDLGKFAELIVRECLSYAKDGDLDFMKFMIKQNFGVEG